MDAFFPLKCLVCGKMLGRGGMGEWPKDPFLTGDLVDLDFLEKYGKRYFDIVFSDFFCTECIQPGLVLQEPIFLRHFPGFISGEAGNRSPEDVPTDKIALCDSEKALMVAALGVYDGPLKKSIHLLKYDGKTCLAGPLGKLLFLEFLRYFSDRRVDMIIPVPLHISRLKKRGFNQAFLLVSRFRKEWRKWKGDFPHWHVNYRLLVRTRNTDSQTGFDRKQRQKNIRGAFSVKQPEKISGKAVVVVDDVYTTGATSREAVRLLYAAGASSVDILVLAKA